MDLNSLQSVALESFVSGKSFFLSGAAGTGKSMLISEFIKFAKDAKPSKVLAVCATTGLAALHIKGRTIDSLMRIFPSDATLSEAELVRTKLKSREWVSMIRELDCMLIDECSMMTPLKFTQCNALLKAARNSDMPFGGIQLVLVGDFFQLPPVNTREQTFIFELDLFYEVLDHVIYLEEVHRQKEDVFIELLKRMRMGDLTEQDKTLLKSRVGAELENDGIKPTILFARNEDVDKINISELNKLNTSKNVFSLRTGCKSYRKKSAASGVDTRAESLQKLLTNLIKDVGLPQSLELRIGAQVMLVYNLDLERGLVNGSRGVVVGFAKTSQENLDRDFDAEPVGAYKKDGNLYYPDDPLPIVKFAAIGDLKPRCIEIPFVRWEKTESNLGEAWIAALPLKLAWSSTIHKCQGSSLDRVEASIDRTVFAYGQAYVAVSRATRLGGLTLKSFDPSVVRAHPGVQTFYKSDFLQEKKRRGLKENGTSDPRPLQSESSPLSGKKRVMISDESLAQILGEEKNNGLENSGEET